MVELALTSVIGRLQMTLIFRYQGLVLGSISRYKLGQKPE